jgi:hypothetical protein
MRTLAAVFASFALISVPVRAQPQAGNNNSPVAPTTNSVAPTAAPVAPVTGQFAPGAPMAGAVAATAGPAGTGPFRFVDAAIKELTLEAGQGFDDCLKSAEYLRRDLEATKRRVKAKGGGKIPSDQAGLIVTKIKRTGRQEQACIEQAKAIGGHFDIAMHSLAGVEPSNHPGIPARRAKIAALREKFNATLRSLKSAGVPLKADEGEADGSQDSGQ